MRSFITPVIIFFVYIIIGFSTVSHYGINWDNPAHFMRGQAFLRFLTTGKKNYSGLPNIDRKNYRLDIGYELPSATTGAIIRRSIYQNQGQEFLYYTQDIPKRGSHPALSDIGAALANYIFFIKLGIAPDIFSYNYYVIFIAALLVATLYAWVRKYFGSFTGFIAVLSLGLYPVFWAESHNNIKDVPEAAFFAFAVFSFYEAVTTKKIKYVLLFAFSCGLAFATKFNLLFLFPIIALWLVTRSVGIGGLNLNPFQFVKEHKIFVLAFLLVPVFMIVFWVSTFPAMWLEPRLFMASFVYYKTIGTSSASHFSLYPLYYLFFATPLITLFYWVVSLWAIFHFLSKEKKDFALLIFFWFSVTIGRVMLPHTSIYGGIRQIMEYIPAMAILVGIGASTIVTSLRIKRLNFITTKQLKLALKIAIFLSFVPITIKLIRLHPNEGVYFNPLIGGLAGAKAHDIPDWGQTLGNPHRQGILWLNKHAEPNAQLSLDYELWANLPHIWVRKDIYYDSYSKSGPLRSGEYIMSVVNKSDFLQWYRFRVMDEFMNPVYEIAIEGVPLLKIWKNDKAHIKMEYKNMKEEKIAHVPVMHQGSSLTLSLSRARKLLRIEFKNDDPRFCENLPEILGSFQIYEHESSSPKSMPASTYDFNGKVVYPKPFFLFAADAAKVIVLNVAEDHSCYSTIKFADVFVIKE